MGNSFCIIGNIRLSLNHHELFQSDKLDLTEATGSPNINTYAGHVMGNYKVDKLQTHKNGKEYDKLSLDINYIDPVNTSHINCPHGLATLIITHRKNKKCTNVVLAIVPDLVKIDPESKRIYLKFTGRLPNDIELHHSDINISMTSQFIGINQPV